MIKDGPELTKQAGQANVVCLQGLDGRREGGVLLDDEREQVIVLAFVMRLQCFAEPDAMNEKVTLWGRLRRGQAADLGAGITKLRLELVVGGL